MPRLIRLSLIHILFLMTRNFYIWPGKEWHSGFKKETETDFISQVKLKAYCSLSKELSPTAADCFYHGGGGFL